MMPKKGMGVSFKLLIAAGLVAGASAFLSAGPLTVDGQPEPAELEVALPAAEDAEVAPMLTPASFDVRTAQSESEDGFRITSPLQIDGEMTYGEYAWSDEGVPDGPIRIVIDLEAERIYVYRGGAEIGQAVILYGHDDTPTPTGNFTITEKDIDHISNLYFVPMPYMLRLTNDGIAIHGSMVEDGYASRGCIGVPDDFAERLFAEAELGDQVLINRGSSITNGNHVAGI